MSAIPAASAVKLGGASEVARRPRTFDAADLTGLIGAALSAAAIVWLIYYRLTPLGGALGFWLLWFIAFLGLHWLIVREREGALAANDKVMASVVTGGALLVIGPLALILGYVIVRGIGALTPTFFTQTLETVGPLSDATEGGALHSIVGTLQQVGIAVAISVPLGVMTAVFLNEIGGRMARPVRMFVDAMSGVPSIVAGLFIYSVVIIQLGGSFSGFAAGLALSVLMLPTVTRTSEEVLRLVPDGLREASLALGAPEWRTTWQVVLPTARAGLVTAVILGVARAIGETAPLIMTSFGAKVLNTNPFSGAQDSLPLFVFQLIQSPQEAQIDRAWTGALVLIALVLILFIAARILGGNRSLNRKSRLRRTRKESAT